MLTQSKRHHLHYIFHTVFARSTLITADFHHVFTALYADILHNVGNSPPTSQPSSTPRSPPSARHVLVQDYKRQGPEPFDRSPAPQCRRSALGR